MSDQKFVSPLLDGFAVGDPISNHDGIRCCPAMRENSDEKYIVKIISIPPTQKQLDALLLTGAFADSAAAMNYFKEMADEVVKEAETLKQLSTLDGFLPYIDWQIVPKEDKDLGYDVYLLCPYKRSLEKHLRRNTITHLGAVNLGLDLCAALSICRRAGFMYVDLKPTNIYLSGKHGFRIGDLGFVSLKSLKYTNLPGKYRSPYTPPELHDPLATLNPTADVYGVGMILYQIYNNGVLPFEDHAPSQPLPAPMNADYEMAEIIAKALNPNPRKRWQTPIEIGQALVSYMQRNTINDVPIVPPVARPEMVSSADAPGEAASEMDEPGQRSDSVSEDPSGEASVPSELEFLNDMVSDETAPDADGGEDVSDGEMTDEVSRILAEADDLLAETDFPTVTEPIPEEPASTDSSEKSEEPEEDSQVEDTPLVPEGETVEDAFDPEPEDDGFPPIVHTTDAEDEDFDDLDFGSLLDPDGSAAATKRAISFQEDTADDEEDFAPTHRPRRKRNKWVPWIVTLLILALVAGGGFFLKYYYLLSIDGMALEGSGDTVTVRVTTDADESLLSIVCTDTYGNAFRARLEDGKAMFNGLTPSTMYKFTLEAEGFHGLIGAEPCSYTTAAQTRIQDFTAKTGNEDGSVILNFSVDGPEKDWVVEYSAPGEEPVSKSFTGHSVTINGLTVDRNYTFKLVSPAEDLWITGTDTLEFTASRIVVAENLYIVSCMNEELVVHWDVPKDSPVANWSVRCYSDSGFDETITVTDTSATFSGIDTSIAYTVEVTASGMTQSSRTYVSANSTTITSVSVSDSATNAFTLDVKWEFEGTAPAGGWLLMYKIGSSDTYEVIPCAENSGVIPCRVPGSAYYLTIQAADGATVFGGKATHETPKAETFNSLSIDGSQTQTSLCPTPKKAIWSYKDIGKDGYRSTYAPNEKVSMVIYSPKKPASSVDDTEVMFIIRDVAGNPIPAYCKVQTIRWNVLWNGRTQYCSLNIPAVPDTPGSYTVEVYFNGALLASKSLTIAS